MTRLSDFADAVHVNLDDATVEKVIGEVNRGTNRQRRRVHWYRQGGSLGPPRQAGGRIPTGESSADGTRVPVVWQRVESIVCHVIAESEDSLDTLLDNLIVAIDHTAPNGSVMLREYTWAATAKDEMAKRVPMVELSLDVKFPVLDEIKQLVEITDEVLSYEIDVPA